MVVQYGHTQTTTEIEIIQPDRIKLLSEVLGHVSQESFPPFQSAYKKRNSFYTWNTNDLQFGLAHCPVDNASIENTAQSCYNELFRSIHGSYLYRVWNYIPKINTGNEDEERYRKFCKGRSAAFQNAFGDSCPDFMPAGSCVGIEGDSLVIYFIGGSNRPDHHENPNQVPAYRYPRRYGPGSPSFARATSIGIGVHNYTFISGTAAVLGHESQGIGNLEIQLEITCDNLDLIASQVNQTINLDRNAESAITGKVYLRNAEDYPTALLHLKRRFPHLADRLIYLKSDICRSELLVEIELTLKS